MRDFYNVKKIARGGFSSVYQATHKVDQQNYAIKKIVLRVRARNGARVTENLQRMLKEVRLFAAINDRHIIRYNHSWLEVIESESKREPSLTPSLRCTDHIDPELDLESPFIAFGQPDGPEPRHPFLSDQAPEVLECSSQDKRG